MCFDEVQTFLLKEISRIDKKWIKWISILAAFLLMFAVFSLLAIFGSLSYILFAIPVDWVYFLYFGILIVGSIVASIFFGSTMKEFGYKKWDSPFFWIGTSLVILICSAGFTAVAQDYSGPRLSTDNDQLNMACAISDCGDSFYCEYPTIGSTIVCNANTTKFVNTSAYEIVFVMKEDGEFYHKTSAVLFNQPNLTVFRDIRFELNETGRRHLKIQISNDNFNTDIITTHYIVFDIISNEESSRKKHDRFALIAGILAFSLVAVFPAMKSIKEILE